MGVEIRRANGDRGEITALVIEGVVFHPVGRLEWGKEPYVSGGADVTTWECQRCFALVARPVKHAERVRCFA